MSVALALAVLAAVLLGCGSPGAAPPSAAERPGPTSALPTDREPSRARAAVDAASAAAGRREAVTLGVAVLDRATGAVEADAAGTQPLRAASVAKLITVADVLATRPAGSASDDDLIRRALGPSDDGAMNVLWSRDGPAGVRRVAGALGLAATAPPAEPSQWGETTTSARDAAVLLAAVADRPGGPLVLDALAAAPPTAADGFDQAYGLLDPAARGPAVAKQGWLCCLDASVDLHSVGLLDPAGRYVVALMSNQPFGYPAARGVLDAAADAVRCALASD